MSFPSDVTRAQGAQQQAGQAEEVQKEVMNKLPGTIHAIAGTVLKNGGEIPREVVIGIQRQKWAEAKNEGLEPPPTPLKNGASKGLPKFE